MSAGDDNKFPHYSNSGLPPSPTIENPGQVYPPTDPSKGAALAFTGTGLTLPM
ncbi:hypothetical protein ARMSODRAFT_954073 [Armillaria solidipes]|uniref:Uncharacterized protein n=1 Tax=Armillaria solidipes TaxID=1076256 RepID=A0A2H3BTV9_9AGAR|nr:hypothetical protein ARMSODRAFT_954073 [Armillaria solidipes]